MFRRRPSLLSLVLTLLGFGFFSVLCHWQYSRALYKDQLFREFYAGQAQPALTLAAATERVKRTRFARVQLQGQFVPTPMILLDSQRHSGRIGVGVFQLFAPDNSAQQVLIARGFLPIPPDRSEFPRPEAPVGTVRLEGLLAPAPSSGIRLGQIEDMSPLDQQRWLATRIEIEKIGTRFRAPVHRYVLLLDPTNPHGFARDWKPSTFGPEKHRGYALTWGLLALTVLIVFVLYVRRPMPLK